MFLQVSLCVKDKYDDKLNYLHEQNVVTERDIVFIVSLLIHYILIFLI